MACAALFDTKSHFNSYLLSYLCRWLRCAAKIQQTETGSVSSRAAVLVIQLGLLLSTPVCHWRLYSSTLLHLNEHI
jgi:hypothetical protein